jgi:predicted metalloprotease
MNENLKKGILILVVVLALVAVGYQAMNMMGGDKMQVEKKISMPPGFKSEKQQALDAQNTAGGAPAKGGGERDLGGPLGGQ